MIRLTVPSIDSEDIQAVRAVLESGLLAQGRNVAARSLTLPLYEGLTAEGQERVVESLLAAIGAIAAQRGRT